MGLISNMETRSRLENPAVPITSESVLQYLGLEPSAAGTRVNTTEKALGLTAFWAGVRIISQTIASLPLGAYERLEKGRRPAREHRINQLLAIRPNRRMTPFTFKELRAVHLLTHGNSYAEIDRDGAGRIIGLWPLLPDRTGVELVNGEKCYYTEIGGKRIRLEPDRVLHVPGMGFDGLRGYSVIQLHRESLGFASAANEYGARFFGNNARPSGYLSHPGKLSPDARERLRDEWGQYHTGLTNAQRTAILSGGLKWESISIPPEDAQFLQTREMQIDEVARILNINPILLQHYGKATTWGSGIAQFLIAFAKFTITPWLERDEDVFNYDLFEPEERGRMYAKYNVNALLRGDPEMQARILEIKRRNGVINADEWRELDEENPLPDGLGSHYILPLNMMPIQNVVEQPANEPTPQPSSRHTKPETRSVKARDRYINSHKPLFEDGANRFVRRDVQNATRAVEKAFKEGKDPTAALNRWIDEFYPGQQRVIYQTMLPIVAALADVVAAEAGAEANITPDGLEDFAAQYTETLAMREMSSSVGQLRSIIKESGEDEMQEALLTRVGEWGEKRPGKIALREVVAVATGAARYVYQQAGVDMVWSANAGACPICMEMDGRRVSSKGYFLNAGDSLSAEGTAPLTVEYNIGGPPLHEGCMCTVVPG